MKEIELRTVEIFKALGSPTRYKIIKLLKEEELYTSEIAEKLNKNPNNISQHLKILKDLDIVRFRTVEQHVYYKLKKREVIKLLNYAEELFSR